MDRVMMFGGMTGLLVMMNLGCDKDERVTEMAREQVQQNERMGELHGTVAEGTRQLVESEGHAREEFVKLHQAVQEERLELARQSGEVQQQIVQQQEAIESERRSLATERRRSPIIAAAIASLGTLLVAALPLVVCILMLREQPGDDEGQIIADLLIEELGMDEIQSLVDHDPNGETERLEQSPPANGANHIETKT